MSLRNTLIGIFIIVVTALLLSKGEPKHSAHWSYDGDEGQHNWASLDKKFEMCNILAPDFNEQFQNSAVRKQFQLQILLERYAYSEISGTFILI